MRYELELQIEQLEDHMTALNGIRGGVKISGVEWDELSGVLLLECVVYDDLDETQGKLFIL
jgi:hypothetical protein